MPVYGYECKKCGEKFEITQRITEDALKTHPDCGGKVQRMVYPVGISFKGSGFYVNDYAKKSQSAADAKAEAAADSKADGGADSKTDKADDSKADKSAEPKSEKPAASEPSKAADSKPGKAAETKPAAPVAKPSSTPKGE